MNKKQERQIRFVKQTIVAEIQKCIEEKTSWIAVLNRVNNVINLSCEGLSFYTQKMLAVYGNGCIDMMEPILTEKKCRADGKYYWKDSNEVFIG